MRVTELCKGQCMKDASRNGLAVCASVGSIANITNKLLTPSIQMRLMACFFARAHYTRQHHSCCSICRRFSKPHF